MDNNNTPQTIGISTIKNEGKTSTQTERTESKEITEAGLKDRVNLLIDDLAEQKRRLEKTNELVHIGFIVLLVMVATLLVMVAFELVRAASNDTNQKNIQARPRYEKRLLQPSEQGY